MPTDDDLIDYHERARLARYVYWTDLGDEQRAAAEPSTNSHRAWVAAVRALRTPTYPTCPRVFWAIGSESIDAQLIRCERPIGHRGDHSGPAQTRDARLHRLTWDLELGIDL